MSNLATIDVTPEPQRSTSVTTPSQLLAMAVQQGADLDKLEKLMALQERWEASEARKAFQSAMAGFKAEPIEIGKNKRVSFTTRDGETTSYSHAELSDVTAAVGPALSKHQLSYRWNIEQANGGITVTCVLTHVLGHSESVTMTAPPDASGKKNAIQQVASTTTYLQRYTLLAITGMSTKGQDDDGRAAEIADETAALIADWLAAIEEAPNLVAHASLGKQLQGVKLSPESRKIIAAAWQAKGKALKAAQA